MSDNLKNLERYVIPLAQRWRYLTSTDEWFAGVASLQPIKRDLPESLSPLDNLISSKLDYFESQKQSLQKWIVERKSLEQHSVTKLEQLMAKCKEHILQQEIIKTLPQNLLFQWEQEIIQCEKDILKERLNSFHDRLLLQKELSIISCKSEGALEKYKFFQWDKEN